MDDEDLKEEMPTARAGSSDDLGVSKEIGT
jgi:hypothetical protein